MVVDVAIAEALERPVVRALLGAIRLRNEHPAFGGTFAYGAGDEPGTMWMEWSDGAARARLDATPRVAQWVLTLTGPDGAVRTLTDARELSPVA